MKPNQGIDYEKFLELAKKLTEEQYGEDNDYSDYKSVLNEDREVEPELPLISSDSIADLTSAKPDAIVKGIASSANIRVGKFLVKIKRYYAETGRGTIASGRLAKTETNLDICIMEEKAKIARKIDIAKDKRFQDSPFIEYFKKSINSGSDIPPETALEIIRWLQVINKIPIFF